MMNVIVFAGTRPEAIKMAPVILALRSNGNFEVTVCTSGQHKEMLVQAFADFSITPDIDCQVMSSGQSLASLSAACFQKIDKVLTEGNYNFVLVQGDTTTVMVAAICAFYNKIPVGHIEAGLRSGNFYSPFPEEINRKIVSTICELHFCPTKISMENLIKENIPKDKVIYTGNTVVDALHYIKKNCCYIPSNLPEHTISLLKNCKKFILVTAHRRENHGAGIKHLCAALHTFIDQHPDVAIVYPVHLNPAVRMPVFRALSGLPRIALTDPLTYADMVRLMQAAEFILTDSGGIQEEAAAMRKPVLIFRDTTERPEGVTAGAAKLIGTSEESVRQHLEELLVHPEYCRRMSEAGGNLYGDGHAADRIVKALTAYEQTSNPTTQG